MKIKSSEIEWPVSIFLVVNSILAIAGAFYVFHQGPPSPFIIGFAILYGVGANLSITAGYHRLFSHRSYEVRPWVEWFYLILGATTFEGSALKWCSDHRVHHAHVDTDLDPYSIKRGFWWAHMGWLFFKESVDRPIRAPDLQRNPRVQFQNKHYYAMAFGFGFGLPLFVGYLVGQPLVGFLIGGSLRVFINQQTTFFINSICHTLGRQTYSKLVTARDSFLVAILTHGEGYHNFHHRFQLDFRNGVRWFDWDPTKWFILLLAELKQASKLRRVSQTEILNARLLNEEQAFKLAGYSHEKIEAMKAKILVAHNRFKEIHAAYKHEYRAFKSRAETSGREKIRELRIEMQMAKAEFAIAVRYWRKSLQLVEA